MKYKVGDKVRVKSLDWYNENKDEFGNIDINYDFTFYADADRSKYCGKVFTIFEVFDNYYSVKEDNNEYYWTDEMIEGLVEDETSLDIDDFQDDNEIIDIIDEYVYRLKNNDCQINLPEGYIFKDENGNEILTSKIILEKKKKEYPKTYEECAMLLGLGVLNELKHYNLNILYKKDLIVSFQKLLICRDAYWKIAGEEMGLGKPWEPDWNIRGYYAIARSYGNVVKTSNYNCDLTFVFPTEEMRDAFYENFKSDIEVCKELL